MNDKDIDNDEVLEGYLEEGISKTKLPPYLEYLSHLSPEVLKALDEAGKHTAICNNTAME